MTLNSKYPLALLATLIIPTLIFAGQAPSVMQRGGLVIERGRTVKDAVVADGDLAVRGRVEGSVFVVNGDALIEDDGTVGGNVTVVGGNVSLSQRAAVQGSVTVFSGLARVEGEARVLGDTRSIEDLSTLTDEKLSVISEYLIFERVTPAGDFPFSELSEMDLSRCGLRPAGTDVPRKLDLYRLGKVLPPEDSIKEARELEFRAKNIRVKVLAIKVAGQAEAEEVWESIREGREEKATNSVHNSLGDGAHWFFRSKGSCVGAWTRGEYIFVVIARHDKENLKEEEWKDLELIRDAAVMELKRGLLAKEALVRTTEEMGVRPSQTP